MTKTERHREIGRPRMQPPQRLTRRAEFLTAAKGRRYHSRSFSLQAVRRLQELAGVQAARPRFGFTVTKKIGTATVRNRIRRRLKEALRLARDLPARPGYDYVIVARPGALDQSFCALQDELRRAIGGIHDDRAAGSKGKRRLAAADRAGSQRGDHADEHES